MVRLSRRLAVIGSLAVCGGVVLGARAWTRRASVIAFAPTASTIRGPLFVFAVDRVPVWKREGPAVRIGASLRSHGIATIVLRLPRNLAGDRAAASTLAALIASALRDHAAIVAGRTLVLGGLGAAAATVATVALDAALPAAAGLGSAPPSRFVALGGRFEPEPGVPATPAGATPVILVASGADDSPVALRGARQFARMVEQQRHAVATFVMAQGRDSETIADLSGDAAFSRGLIGFIRGDAPPPDTDPRWSPTGSLNVAAWPSTESFAIDTTLVRHKPMTPKLRARLMSVLGGSHPVLNAYAMESYRSVDLETYLRTRLRSEVEEGDFLTVANLRGERFVLTRDEVKRLRPEVVIGLDDEVNLFRLMAVYRLKRSYSWLEERAPMPWATRPVGGLLFFPGDQPRRFPQTISAASGLTTTSFRWQRADPLERTRHLSAPMQEVLLGGAGCLHCHALHGQGARSQHALLEDPRRRGGGVALALEEYPEAVLHAFLFDQDRVAQLFGVNPAPVASDLARELEALVRSNRASDPSDARTPAAAKTP